MAPRQRELPSDPDGKTIVKLLDTLTAYGHRQDRIFEDWLAYCEASLRMLPQHAASIAATGRPAKDGEEDARLFALLRDRYGDRGNWAEVFARALAVMTDAAAAGEVKDLVGEIYMAYGWPNAGTGQFFTPMPVARMMAGMLLNAPDVMAQVKTRVLAAAEKTPLGQAMMLAGLACPQEEASEYFLRVVMPELMPHIEPVTFSDPCCGSGVMFLGAAQALPRWVTQFGVVMFHGQDIDPTCVQMAKVNIMLYGLNGWGAKWMAAEWIMAAKLRATGENQGQETGQEPVQREEADDVCMQTTALAPVSFPVEMPVLADAAAQNSQQITQQNMRQNLAESAPDAPETLAGANMLSMLSDALDAQNSPESAVPAPDFRPDGSPGRQLAMFDLMFDLPGSGAANLPATGANQGRRRN